MPGVNKKCLGCGKMFYYNSDRVNRHFCDSCESVFKRDTTRMRCDWCGKGYFWEESTALNKNKYCCKRCEAKL